jgi:nicotinate-nucleotide adenylyltransferase
VRLGVFGGSFDPPHLGHLLAAVDALEHLALHRIIFVPNSVQPLKGEAEASPAQRLQMLRLAVAGEDRFEVSSIEVDRKGLSYTVDTLDALSRLHAGAELFFLAGADAVRSWPRWKDRERILEVATFALLTRTVHVRGSPAVPPGEGDAHGPESSVASLPEGIGGAIRVPTRTVEISSSEIRARIGAGLTVKGFVAESVERFITEFGLYKRVMA